MRVLEEKTEYKDLEREADILERDEGHDSEKNKKKGKRIAAVPTGRVNTEDHVVEQLVGQLISSTVTQNHV